MLAVDPAQTAVHVVAIDGHGDSLAGCALELRALPAELLARGPVDRWRRVLELVCDLSERRGELVRAWPAPHGCARASVWSQGAVL